MIAFMTVLKKILKKLACIFITIILLPLIISSWIEKIINIRNDIFSFSSQLLSLVPGSIGSYFRVCYYAIILDEFPYDTFIGFGSYFSQRSAIIKKGVNIGAFCILGKVTILKDVMIGSRVSVTSGKRQHINSDGKVDNSIFNPTRVTIGEKTWVGECSIIMDDLGRECIVSAGSVVSKPSPDNIVAVGNPARYLRIREGR